MLVVHFYLLPWGFRCRRRAALCLRCFDPEEDVAEDWLLEVEAARKRYCWDEWETVRRSASCLVGKAKIFFDSWRPKGADRGWSALKLALAESFPRRRKSGSLLVEAATYGSVSADTYADYAGQKLLKLRKICLPWPENVLVECVIHGIADPLVRVNVSNQNIKNVADLIACLSSYEKPFCPVVLSEGSSLPKRAKRSSTVATFNNVGRRALTCHGCGAVGHLRRNCRSRPFNEPGSASGPRSKFCEHCKKSGHLKADCWARGRTPVVQSNKRVSLCQSHGSGRLLTVVIGDVTTDCLPDTGSDCSLIRDRVASRLRCKRTPVCVNLKGIAEGRSVSFSLVSLVI